MSLFYEGTCDVCGRGGRQVGVCASAWGPVSYANCQECLQKPAETLSTFNYLYDEVGPDNMDPRIKNWYTWMDGRYVHWTNYVAKRQQEQKK